MAMVSTLQKSEAGNRLVLYSSNGKRLGTRFGISHDPSTTLILAFGTASDRTSWAGVTNRIDEVVR